MSSSGQREVRLEIARILSQYKQGNLGHALRLARSLVRNNPNSALAYNTLGKTFSWFYVVPDGDPRWLERSRDCYLEAMRLAPFCAYTRLMYARILYGLNDFVRAGQELMLIGKMKCIFDPLAATNMVDAVVTEDAAPTVKERIDATLQLCEVLKRMVHRQLLVSLLNLEMTPAERIMKAKDLSDAFPAIFGYCYAHMLSILQCADNSQKGQHRSFLETALPVARKATEDFQTSLIASLFYARLLFLLGHHNDAERECYRALRIENPMDPKMEELCYLDGQTVFEGEIKADGDTRELRVACIKGHFTALRRLIVGCIETHWITMASSDRRCMLTSRVDSFMDYCSEANNSVVSTVLEAIKFFETQKQWYYWVCPECPQNLFYKANLLWNHICGHSGNFFDQIRKRFKWEEDYTPSGICLWKGQGGHRVLTSENSEAFCFPMPWDEIKSFRDFKKMKSKKRSLNLKKLKEALSPNKDDDANNELNQLWCSVVRNSKVDYCEYLLPILRSYELTKLQEDLTRVLTKMEIEPEVIHLIFFAADIESENGSEDAVLKERCTAQDQLWLKYWRKKLDRGYKWFLDLPLPNFEDYTWTWLSDDDASPNPMPRAQPNWEMFLSSYIVVPELHYG